MRFRLVARARESSYTGMATGVMDLAQKCTDADSVREVIAVEQLLNSMPVRLRIWVRERKPKTVVEAGRLADDYAEARDPLEGRRVQGARSTRNAKILYCIQRMKLFALSPARW